MCETKKCSKCQEVKPLSEFSKQPRASYGVSAWCKLCERNNSREWRKNNPEKLGKPKLTEHEWEIRRIEAHTRKLTRTNAWRALNKDAI